MDNECNTDKRACEPTAISEERFVMENFTIYNRPRVVRTGVNIHSDRIIKGIKIIIIALFFIFTINTSVMICIYLPDSIGHSYTICLLILFLIIMVTGFLKCRQYINKY